MKICYLRFLICLGFCIWCSGLVDVGAKGDDLRFRFQPGDKFYLTSAVEQKITRVVDGNEVAIEQAVRLGCDLDIEEVSEDGSAWAKLTYIKTALNIKGGGADISFDSDAAEGRMRSAPANVASTPALPASAESKAKPGLPKAASAAQPRYNTVPPQALTLVLALREGFYIQITPQGRIGKINGLQEIVSSAKGKMPNSDIKPQVIQAVERQFDEAAVKKELEGQLAVFPRRASAVPGLDVNLAPQRDVCEPASPDSRLASRGRPVIEVGDTWSRSEQVEEDSNGSPIITEQTFRLKERRPGGIAVVDVNIVVQPSGNAQETVIANVKARREIRGRGSGQIEIEESTGRIINSTLTEDLIEETKYSPQGMMLRIPPNPEPTRWHIVTTFQMTKREEETASKPAEPNRP
jgi:hypothetical protein